MKPDFKQAPSPQWIAALRQQFPTERVVDEILTKKMQRRQSPPEKSWTVGDVESALNRFLAKRITASFEISAIRLLGGGGSKEQYRFSLTRRTIGDEKMSEDLVLRIQPQESIVETSRQREFEIIDALKDTLPVPRAYWVDANGAQLGRPALIYSFLQGVTKPPSDSRRTHDFDLWSPRYRNLVASEFIDCLAKIATFDIRNANLPSFDLPRAGTADAVISVLNWFERVWEEDSLEPYPLMTMTAKWLRDNAPSVDQIAIVHGDYRQGNFLFDLDTGKITGVLDWEQAHFGDSHEDIAYAMLPIFTKKDETGADLIAGLCSRDEFLSRYESASGRRVDFERLAYYEILNLWRCLVMGLATGQRCILGRKTQQDLLLAHNAQSMHVFIAALLRAMHERL